MAKWFMASWWHYLFDKNKGMRNVWCRLRGHPEGVVWYNSGGFEPDMRCKNCGENLG